MDYAVRYDPNNDNHTDGLLERLCELRSRNLTLPRGRAVAIANLSDELFQTTLVCGDLNGRQDAVKGMAISTFADAAAGRMLFLESLFVTEMARRQGCGRMLIDSVLIHALNYKERSGGLNGLAWEMGRDDKTAALFCASIDSSFSVRNLNNAWHLSERQCANLAATEEPRAELATRENLTAISRTLRDQPDVDMGRLSDIIREQGYNRANPFIVYAQDGSFLIASRTFSVFPASMRIDARVHHMGDICSLIRGAAQQITRRGWRGHMHIELSNNVLNLEREDLFREKRKAEMAAHDLKNQLGAEILVDDSEMVPYQITGREFYADVILAVTRSPQIPLTAGARQRIMDAASTHDLPFPGTT
ncbi:MAG TPA: hypothetical protein VMV79_03185 [Alphaproteobacteria bacterium]|nr:hypothetical protein [Alphaproteobacteria bacterium]